MDAKSQTNLVRNCFSKLISHLSDKYPVNEHAVYKDRSSLINQLDHGLHRALTPTSQERPSHVVTSQVSMVFFNLYCYKLNLLLLWHCHKVMFLHVSVILFGGGSVSSGGSASVGESAHKGGAASRGGWADTPAPGTRKAGGTHPTGILSCLKYVNTNVKWFVFRFSSLPKTYNILC